MGKGIKGYIRTILSIVLCMAMVVTPISIKEAEASLQSWVDPSTGHTWSYRERDGGAQFVWMEKVNGSKPLELTIPSEINGLPVMSIGGSGTDGYLTVTGMVGGSAGTIKNTRNERTKTVIVPNTVKRIYKGAFSYLVELENLIFEEGSQLERIDGDTFTNVYKLKKLEIPENVTYIATNILGTGSTLSIPMSPWVNLQDDIQMYKGSNGGLSVDWFAGVKERAATDVVAVYVDGIALDNSQWFSYKISGTYDYYRRLVIDTSAFDGYNVGETAKVRLKFNDIENTLSNDNTAFVNIMEANTDPSGELIKFTAGKPVENSISGSLNIDGTLTLNGSGLLNGNTYSKLYSTSVSNKFDYRGLVKKIVIGDGITGADRLAFSGLYNVESVDLPATFKELGGLAFSDCKNLEVINGLENLTSIKGTNVDGSPFRGCDRLQLSKDDFNTELDIKNSGIVLLSKDKNWMIRSAVYRTLKEVPGHLVDADVDAEYIGSSDTIVIRSDTIDGFKVRSYGTEKEYISNLVFSSDYPGEPFIQARINSSIAYADPLALWKANIDNLVFLNEDLELDIDMEILMDPKFAVNNIITMGSRVGPNIKITSTTAIHGKDGTIIQSWATANSKIYMVLNADKIEYWNKLAEVEVSEEPSVELQSGTFDLAKKEDVAFNISMGTGSELATNATIKINGLNVESQHYTVNEDTLIINKDAFDGLDIGNYNIEVTFNNVSKTVIANALSVEVISTAPIVEDQHIQFTGDDVVIDVELGSATNIAIVLVGGSMVPKSNWELKSNTLTIKAPYFIEKAVGEYEVTIIFNDEESTTYSNIVVEVLELGNAPSIEAQAIKYNRLPIQYNIDLGSGLLGATDIIEVTVNGVVISSSYYIIEEGTLTITDDYLSVLSNGAYTVGVKFNDAEETEVNNRLSFTIPKDTSIVTNKTSLLNIIYLYGSANPINIPLTGVSSITELWINTSLVDQQYYSFNADRSVLTISNELLNVLGTGSHSVIITYNSGGGMQGLGRMGGSTHDIGIIISSISVGTTGLTYKVDEDGNAIIDGYTGDEKEIEIPDNVDGLPVTGIDDLGDNPVDSVIVPDTVEDIAPGAIHPTTEIEASPNSPAEDYANNNGNKFIPAEPGDGEPTEPGDGEPTEPGDGEPTDPTEPGDGEPTEPGDGEPTDPGDGEPTEPGDGEPTEPTDPGDGEPTDPGNSPNIKPQLKVFDVSNPDDIVIEDIELGDATAIDYIIIGKYKIYANGTIEIVSDIEKLSLTGANDSVLTLFSVADDQAQAVSGGAITIEEETESELPFVGIPFTLSEDGTLVINSDLLKALNLDTNETYPIQVGFNDGSVVENSVALNIVDSKEPTDPSDGEPTDPSDGEPTDPSDGEPTDPSDGEPTDPSDGEPTDPSDGEPTDPSDGEPTDPSDGEPTDPSDGEPTDPSDGEPTDPSDGEPTDPSDGEPTDPKDPPYVPPYIPPYIPPVEGDKDKDNLDDIIKDLLEELNVPKDNVETIVEHGNGEGITVIINIDNSVTIINNIINNYGGGVYIDDTKLSDDEYIIDEENGTIEIDKSVIDKLEEGDHTISVGVDSNTNTDDTENGKDNAGTGNDGHNQGGTGQEGKDSDGSNDVIYKELHTIRVIRATPKVDIVEVDRTITVGSKIKINIIDIDNHSTVKYKSSNKKIATITKNGDVNTKKAGKVLLTVTSVNKGVTTIYKVTLRVTNKQGNKSIIDTDRPVYLEGLIRLNTDAEDVKFDIKNKKLLTINKTGLVRPKRVGTTDIAVTETTDQLQLEYVVKLRVRKPYIKFTRTAKTVKVGKSFDFNAKSYDSISDGLKWFSTNTDVATINHETGVLKAVKKGETTVVVTCGKSINTYKIKVN